MIGSLLLICTFVGYFAASALYVGALYDQRREPWARGGVYLGWSAQTVYLLRTTVILGALPIFSLYHWMAWFVWLMTGSFLVIQHRRHYAQVGSFLIPIVFLLWTGSQWLVHKAATRGPPFLVGWLDLHIALATASYAAFLLAAIFGIMYMEKERELKRKKVRLFYYQLPPLEDMDLIASRLIMLGLPFLTVAMYLGAQTAKVVWGSYWTWTPKEMWSFMTWLVYLVYLMLRGMAGWRGHRSAIYAMLAFILVIFNFVGVNLLFPGPGGF